MKQRVGALDLQILTAELQKEITDYRLANIYNISTSNKQYLLKFAIPDSKKNLVLDSGFKIHLTDFTRPTPPQPTNFVTKLRKHLKTRRLSSIKQVGIDRVVVLTFSDGLYHLVLEFFSAGNIILLDDQRRILALQRLVEEKDNNDRYAVGEIYNHFDESLFDESEPQIRSHSSEDVKSWILAKKDAPVKDKKTKVLSIQKVLYQQVPYLSADLIAKHLKANGIDPLSSSLDYESNTELVSKALIETEKDIQTIINAKPINGYILTKKNPLYDPSKDDEDLKVLYDQFHPFEPLLKSEDEATFEVKGYNKTLDKFFSTIESSKYALRIQNQENQAKRKLEAARKEKHQQVQRLIDAQEVNKLKGETIIFNAELVEQAKAAVQALLDQQMDWKSIEKLIKVEQGKGNKVAKLINLPLQLKQNKISLNLSTEDPYEDDEDNSSNSDSYSDSGSDSDSDEEGSTPKTKAKDPRAKTSINVSINLSLSAFANASEYFTVKKTTVEKQKRVEQSASKALKNIEEKVGKDLKRNLKQEVDILKKLRKPYFFEKFNWFLSNENYLIISGKDDSQTDLIYHRYIQPDDIYVSADIDGAAHVFIINPNKGEVSPSTLTQAGILALATSKAWDSKAVTSPWWCYATDVTKMDIDSKLLKAGSFRYLKDKNFLPPAQLVMGFGFVWKIKTERNQRELDEQLDELENLDINDLEVDSKEVTTEEPEEGNVVEDKGETPADEEELKGTQQAESALSASDHVEDVIQEPEEDTFSTATTSSTSKAKQKKAVRGKKGKLKKISEKYGDQDEEERQLRMEALGTLKQNQKKEEGLKKQQVQKINHLKKIEKRKRQEELTADKYNGKKENIDLAPILDELTGMIAHEDEILEAIPVFAPWQALNKFRYRVKIQPGSTKKGKALQEILHYFSIRPTDATENDRLYDWPREHEEIKTLKDLELLPSIYVGKVKVMLPGKSSAAKKSTGGSGKKSKKK